MCVCVCVCVCVCGGGGGELGGDDSPLAFQPVLHIHVKIKSQIQFKKYGKEHGLYHRNLDLVLLNLNVL